jgi:hypothetical protein
MFEIMLKTYIIYYQIVDLLFNTYKGTPYNVNETHCQCFPHCSQIFKLFGFLIFRFWAYLMKVILSVPDEGYFERTWWRLFWAYLMKVILSVPDEDYLERTWWRLFQNYAVSAKLYLRFYFLSFLLPIRYFLTFIYSHNSWTKWKRHTTLSEQF